MAKKGQAAQLQIEINNDEDWEKLLLKEGLIVVDVYSEWCGPCLGMQANLKKLKLEVGGDLLQLAIGKTDNIASLERFRNKSEPTWMFISKGKMVNLMFGADAPKLTRMIIAELKKEQMIIDGQTPPDRKPLEITEMGEEEQARYDVVIAKVMEAKAKEEAKIAKELLERRTKECNGILENLNHFGIAIILPTAKDRYKEVIGELLDEAGLTIQQTEKVNITEEQINELCFFSNVNDEFSPEALEAMIGKQNFVLLFKAGAHSDVEDVDDALLKMVYGPSKSPPGTADSLAHKLAEMLNEMEFDEENVKPTFPEVWSPRAPMVKATALRVFFEHLSNEYIVPPPPPEPEHLAVIFEFIKKDEAIQAIKEYPEHIMKYGIFTSEVPEDTQLVAKTFHELEKKDQRTFTEKIIIQLSKQKSECVLAFASLEPFYMSPNASEGKRECALFFPDDYEPGIEDFEAVEETPIPPDMDEDEEYEEEGDHLLDAEEVEYDEGESEDEVEFEGDEGMDFMFEDQIGAELPIIGGEEMKGPETLVESPVEPAA